MGTARCQEYVYLSPRIKTHLDVLFAILETRERGNKECVATATAVRSSVF